MPRFAKAHVSLWGPPVLYMTLIFYLSSLSNPVPEVTTRVWDKLLHLVEYAVLGVLFGRALAGEGLRLPAAAAVAIVLTSVYGASDEFHQSLVPGRHSELADWMVDTLGASIGALGYATRRRERRI